MAGRQSATGRSERTRPPLNRDLILDVAVAFIEERGAAAMSMRHLGARLGVEAMTIYHYFENREQLLRAIGDRLLEPMQDLELGGDWREACRRFATALRNIAVARPATFALLGLQPFDSPSSLGSVERLLDVLVAGGFPPVEALAVYRATVSYARGYALAEATGFTVDATHAAGRKRLAGLGEGEFPILAGRVKELRGLDADAGYEFGLEALISGLPEPGSVLLGDVGKS